MDNTTPLGNTKTSKRSRKWCFTLNNWTVEEYNTITQAFSTKKWDFIIGKEIGEEKETPHLQMFVRSKNPISFETLKKINERMKIICCKGSTEQNVKYCSKDNDFKQEGLDEYLPKQSIEERLLEIEYKDVIWKDWQRDILNTLNGPINKRTIIWIWETTGNVGKSFLCKYIAMKYNCIIATGKTADIFNQTLEWRENFPDELQIPPVIIDIPRSEFAHINYAALEQLKNGFLYSGKYNGGKVFGLSPHCFVYANSPPEFEEMSEDRFIIIEL